MNRFAHDVVRDLVVAIALCGILMAVFWTQRKRGEDISTITEQRFTPPLYSRCPRDEYPCPNEEKHPWNSRAK
jgi:hypothetical protein